MGFCQYSIVPRGMSDRLMMIRLKLTETSYATIISAYAPTMTYPDADSGRW